MQTKEINVVLPANAVQYIINVLDERPHREVSELLKSIVSQANAQLSVPAPVATPEAQGDAQ